MLDFLTLAILAGVLQATTRPIRDMNEPHVLIENLEEPACFYPWSALGICLSAN